jgi:two-component sensor histidine kinase
VSFGVDVALPLGLIINELISNSLKYAFPDGGEGEVRIGINHLDDGQLQLVVADSGVGFPSHIDFRNTETLGMQLVLALAGQIGGSIDLKTGPGTEFRILFRP